MRRAFGKTSGEIGIRASVVDGTISVDIAVSINIGTNTNSAELTCWSAKRRRSSAALPQCANFVLNCHGNAAMNLCAVALKIFRMTRFVHGKKCAGANRVCSDVNRAGADVNMACADTNRACADVNRACADVNTACADTNRAGAGAHKPGFCGILW